MLYKTDVFFCWWHLRCKYSQKGPLPRYIWISGSWKWLNDQFSRLHCFMVKRMSYTLSYITHFSHPPICTSYPSFCNMTPPTSTPPSWTPSLCHLEWQIAPLALGSVPSDRWTKLTNYSQSLMSKHTHTYTHTQRTYMSVVYITSAVAHPSTLWLRPEYQFGWFNWWI